MRKQFFLNSPASFFILLVILLTLCNSANASPSHHDTLVTSTKTITVKPLAKTASLSGELHYLYMDAQTFLTLPNRITFRFYIDPTSGYLSLQGWAHNNFSKRHYSNAVKITLTVSTVTHTQFAPGDCFGNLYLVRKDVRAIKEAIDTSGSAHVVFEPEISMSDGNQVIYNISVSKREPLNAEIVKVDLTATGKSANPSPPRNGN